MDELVWASNKSSRRKEGGGDDPDGPGRNAERNFYKDKRSNVSIRGRPQAGRLLAALVRSSGAIDLIADDLSQVFETEVGEGHALDTVDVVDPQLAVFGIELVRYIPQQVFVAA